MLDTIESFFSTAPVMAWSIVGILAAAIVIAAMWEKVNWWWMNTWVSFPVVGGIARYAKDTNEARGHENWLKSERTLCMKYKQFVPAMSEHEYNECVEYLVLAGDNGRRHMPGWLWPVIMLMVFVEAMGFSYVLAGFTVPGASENVQQYGAYGIAFLISGLLIFLTHFSGHELYRNSKINESRAEWNGVGRTHELKSKTVPLSWPQNTDAAYPEYTRRINRIESSVASFKVSIGTAALVLLIAIGATYVRGQVLEKMLTAEVVSQTTQIESQTAAASDGLDMSDVVLPAADQKIDNNAQVKAVEDSADNDRAGGWATFIILAIIFAALQALGIYFGFHWGFAGKNSDSAFKAIGGGKFGTYQEVVNHYNYIADVAQSKLEMLQQRMMEYISHTGTSSRQAGKHTFRDFMRDERESQARDRDHQRDHARTENDARVSEILSATASPPLAPPTQADASVGVAMPVAENIPSELKTALSQIHSLANKDDIKKYIGNLPEPLRNDVMTALKEARENEKEMAARLDAELEDLL